MLTQNYILLNGTSPDEATSRKIRMEAYKGLKELENKNNALAAGDVAQTALSLVPWFKWGKGLNMLMNSRVAANALKGGISLGVNAVGESIEEGEQFLSKKDYMNNNFMSSHGILDYAKQLISDKGDVTAAVFGQGRYDLYGDKDFRQAVKSGLTTGLLFDAANTTLAKMAEYYDYNKTKSELSKEAMQAAEDSYTRYKANTLYGMFAKGKQENMYQAIESFGKKGLFGYTKETADAEVKGLQKLKEQYDDLNDAIKTPTGRLYTAYVNSKKGTDVALAAELLKKEAFENFIKIENYNTKLKELYEKNETPENLDQYGYISSDQQSITDEVNKQAEKLGLDPNTTSRLKNNRIDTTISAIENKLNTLKARTKSIMTGEAIAQKEEEIREIKAFLSEKNPVKQSRMKAVYDFKYKISENAAIEAFKLRDSMFESLHTADNIKIVKDLDNKRDLKDLLEEITSANLPLDGRVYERLKKAAEPISEMIVDMEAQLEAAESEEAYNALYAEYEKIPDVSDLLEKAKGQVQPLFRNIKSDDEYRREYHDGYLNDVAAVENLLESPDNEPIDQASALESLLEGLDEVYTERKELHSRAEFDGFREALNDALTRIKAAVAEIERRSKDREAKNIRLANEKALLVYDIFGIDQDANGKFKVENPFPFSGLTTEMLEEAVKGLNDYYEKTGIISTVFIEKVILTLKSTTFRKENLSLIDSVFYQNFNEIGALPGVSKRAADNYAINPEKGFKDVYRSLTKSLGDVYFNAILEYNRTRSVKTLIDTLNKVGVTVSPELSQFLNRHILITGLTSVKESIETNYQYPTQVADEKEFTEAKNFKSAPSIQQRQALHSILKWLGIDQDQSEMYQGFGYLSGFAGTGKTFLAGLIRKFLPHKDSELFVVAHSKSAATTLAESLELDLNKPKYKSEQESPLDHLTDLLTTNSPLLKDTKLIIMDEAGFVASDRMNLLARLIMDYNKNRAKGDKIKVLALGDAYQIAEGGYNTVIDANTGSQINIKIFSPLSVVYRTGVSDIVNTANRYFDNRNPVKELFTRTNRAHTEGVVTSNVESDLIRELQNKQKEGALDDSRTRLVIVQDEAAVQRISAILTHPSIKVVSYINAQGLTADEAYISLAPVEDLEEISRYNKAIYTSITRARHYVHLVDKNLSKINPAKIVDSFNNAELDNAAQIEKQKTDYVETVNSEYEYLKETGTPVEPSLNEVEVEETIQEEVVTTTEPNIPELADTQEVAVTDLAPVVPIVPATPAKPGEHSLMYPQGYVPSTETGTIPIAIGDEVLYVKAMDKDTGKVHIRVVKPIDARKYTLVGILGTDPKEGLTELDELKTSNPTLYNTIVKSLSDDTLPTEFTADPSQKDLLTLGLNQTVNSIATAKIKHYNPAGIKFSDELSDIDDNLKARVSEDVRKILLKSGQSATAIDIQGVIYTLQGRKTGYGVGIEEIPKSQAFIKVGIPYLRVRVTLATKGVSTFHVNLKFSKLDPERHEKWLSPLTQFLDSVTELEDIYEKAGVSDSFGYNDPRPSNITKVNKDGNPFPLSKGELFRKSIQWYPGSGGLDQAGEAEGIAYLANPKNTSERTLEEILRSKLTPEELQRVYELRSTLHNLTGVAEFKSQLTITGLTEMDRIPEEEPEAPVNKSTNKEVIGKTKEGFTVFAGTKGNVGVKYYKYLGYWFKIKIPAVKVGNDWQLRGPVKCRIQTTLEASSAADFSVRDNLSIGLYDDGMFDGTAAVQSSLEAIAAQAKQYIGPRKGSGGAQAVMHVLAKVNSEVTVPGLEGKFPIRYSGTSYDDEGGERTVSYGINLMPDEYTGDVPTLDVLDAIHNNTSGDLNFPVKALHEDYKTENGDYFDTSLVQTDYDGFVATAIVLEDIKVKDEPTAPSSTSQVFTRATQEQILPKGTPIFGGKVADGKTKFLNSDLGFNIGDKITFFDERERTGIWNGSHIVETGTNNPWGVSGILMNPNNWIRKENTVEKAATSSLKDTIARMNRLGSKRTGKTLSKYSTVFLGSEITEIEAFKAIQKYIPDIAPGQVRFVSEAQMLQVTGGTAAWGFFKDGVIYLESNQGKVWANAARHEVFHKIFWNSFDATERLHYYKLALKNNPSLKGKNVAEVEEWLAEEFQVWKNTGKTEYVGFKGLFKRVLDFIRFIFTNHKALDRLFTDIEAGKFTTRHSAVGVSRPLTKINEKFGSIAVYKAAKELFLDYMNNFTNQYRDPKTGVLLTVEDIGNGVYDNIPLTIDEAKARFKAMAEDIVNAYTEGIELPENIAAEVPYYQVLLRGKNMEEVTKDFYKFSQDFSMDEIENDLREFFEGTVYEGDANLKQEIEAAEFVNLETKVTDNVKDVLNSVYYENSKGERKHLKWTFCYLKMLQMMQYVDFHNPTKLKSQINTAFKFQNTQNPAIKALYQEVNDLFELSEIGTYNVMVDGKLVTRRLPPASFSNNNTFNYAAQFVAKSITRTKKETTIEFFKRISNASGLELDAINILFRKQRAINTINEFVSHFGSQRERNPVGGVVRTTPNDMGGDDLKFLFNTPNNANIEQAIETDIAAYLLNAVTKNKAKVSSYNTKFKAAVKIAKTNQDKVDIVKTFFSFLGKSINTDTMITEPALITDAIRDIQELLAGALSAEDVAAFIEQSEGRIQGLASLVAFHSPEVRAANYIDPKNRRMYKWVSQSGSYSLLSRISKHFKFEFKGVQSLPDFVVNQNLGDNRFAKHNIFLNGANKIEQIVDPQYLVYSKSGKVIEYKNETKADALTRRFNVQFLGYMLKNAKDKNPQYIQSVYTISNKPVTMGVTVNALGEKQLKSAIKEALLFELGRKDYIDALKNYKDSSGKLQSIQVKNLDKAANQIYFNEIGNVSESKKAGMLANIDAEVEANYNKLIERARVAYAKYKLQVDDGEDSRMYGKSAGSIFEKVALKVNEEDFLEDLYVSYYLNNYVNGFFLSHLYFGDRAFAKLNKWDDVIKRLQSSFGIGKTPAIGPNAAMPTFKIVVAKDDKLFINANTDYTGTLQKLYNDKGYDSTDAQMYVLPSFVASIRAGLGSSTATKDVLKPVYFGIDKFGIPRLVKTSAIELTDELVADFPELRAIRDSLISSGAQAYVFESAMKIGTPVKLSERGKPVEKESIVELNTADLRIQLNPLAKLDSEVASFSQLLYLLNVNRLNTEVTEDVYKTNAILVERNLQKLMHRITDSETGQFSEKKLRKIVLQSFMDSSGRVMSGSERLYELLSLGIKGADRVAFEGPEAEGKEMTHLSLSMPSLVKKVITQLSSPFTGTVALKFRGTKAVLTSASPIKLYENDLGETVTYSALTDLNKQRADNFYTQFTPEEQSWLIKAKEAKDFGAIEKFTTDFKSFNGTAVFADKVNMFLNSSSTNTSGTFTIPRRLRMMSSTDGDKFKNYAEAVVPYDMAKSIADKLGIDMNELKNTMIGVRIPSTGIHSSIPIKIVAFLNTRSNIISVPEEVVPLHGSDFDVDSLFVIKREELTEKETNDTVELKETYLTKKEQLFFNSLFEDVSSRNRAKFGDKFDSVRAKKEFAKSVGVWYSETTNNFEKYSKEKSNRLDLDKIKVLNSVPRILSSEESARFQEMFEQESAIISAKVAEKQGVYVPEIHREAFAKENRIMVDPETGRFFFGAVRIAVHGDFIGYKDSSLDDNYIEYLDSEIEHANKFVSDDPNQINRAKHLVTTLENLKDKYYKNRVMQGYLSIVTDEKNRADMNTPISMSVFTDYTFERLRELLGTPELLGNLDPNDDIDQVDIQLINMSGAQEVGKIANTMKGLSYLSYIANFEGKEATINYGEVEPFKIDGVSVTKLQDNQLPMNTDNSYSSWEILDSLINAAIDNVKEQILGIINLNANTGNVYCTLIGCGVPIEHAVLLMHQPAIKEVLFYTDKTSLNKHLDELRAKLVPMVQEEGDSPFKYHSVLTRKLLEDGVRAGNIDAISNSKALVEAQIGVIDLFKFFNSLGEDVFKATSGINLTRSLPIEIDGVRESISNLESTVKESFAFQNTDLNKIVHIAKAKEVAKTFDEVVRTIIVGQKKETDALVAKLVSKMSIRLDYMNATKNLELVKEELIKYLMSSYKDYVEDPTFFFSGKKKTVYGNEAWIQDFMADIYNIKNEPENEGNAFLQYVSTETVSPTDEWLKMTFTAGTALSDDEKLDVANDFLKLPVNIQKDFLKYAVLVQGMRFGVSSYSTYMNPVLQAGLSEYLEKEVADILVKEEKFNKVSEHFGIQLSLKKTDKLMYVRESDIMKNHDEVESWEVAINTEGKLPLFLKRGKKESYSLLVLVKEEIAAEVEGKPTIKTGYYTKVGDPKDGRYEEFISQMYSTNTNIVENGWTIADRFDVNSKVLTAPEGVDASTISTMSYSVSGKKIIVGKDKKAYYPSKYTLEEGTIVAFRNTRDVLRNQLFYYRVKSASEVEIEGNPVQNVVFEKVNSPSLFAGNVGSLNTYSAIQKANGVEEFKKCKNLKDLIVYLSNNAVTPEAKLILAKIRKYKDQIGNIPIKDIDMDKNTWSGLFQSGDNPYLSFNLERLLSNGDVNKDLSDIEHTVVHELVHVLLRHTLQHKENMSIKGEVLKSINRLELIYQQFKKVAKEQNIQAYGFVDVDEFMAEFMSNSQFRSLLATMMDESKEDPTSKKTLFDTISEILKKILDFILGRSTETEDLINAIHQDIVSLIDISQPSTGMVEDIYGMDQKFSFFKPDGKVDAEFSERLKDLSENLEVSEDEKEYINKVTGKRYTRSSEFRNAFNPYPSKDYNRADEDFKYKDKATDKIRTYFNNKEVFMTYDEYKKHLEKLANTERVKGRVVHKIIQMLSTGDMSLSSEVISMSSESDTNYEVNWRSIQTWLLETWKDRLKELGISTGKISGAVLGIDKISSEVAVAIEELGVAGTIDMVVQHDDGTYTLVDFKSGKSLTRRSRFPKIMAYSKNNAQIEWNAMSQAKLQLMLYAVMMKSMNRNVKFRDIFVSHIDMNTITDNANPVEFKSYLEVLEEYFKNEKSEWYALNKDLFNPANYGGTLAEVDSDMAFNDANPVQQQKLYDTKLRKINLLLEGSNLKVAERAELEEKARDLAHKILQLESIGVRIDDHNKDMSMPRLWVDNMYNVSDPMAQAFAKYTFDRKNNMRQHLFNLKEEHNAMLRPILAKNQGNLNRVAKGLTFGGLNFNSYNKLFGFLYKDTPEGRKFATEQGNMTAEEWEYSKYLRTTMKYEFYLTMSPKKLIAVITADLKTKTGIEKTLAERYLELAKNAPKIDKFNEFSAFRNRDFVWEDSFIPYIPEKDGEAIKMADMFKGSTYKRLLDKYIINKFTSEAIHKSFENYGMPIKFMTSAGFNDDQFTINSASIFENFMASTVGKRYLDDIYSLGRATANYFEYTQNAEKTGFLKNTAKFIQNQTILHTTNEKQETQWFSKAILVAGDRKLSIDSIIFGLKSYMSALVLVGKFKAGVVNGIMEIVQNHKEALVGSIGQIALSDKRFVDFTLKDLTLANKAWIELQGANAIGKSHDNKLYNLLKKFNYQTDNRMYPTNKGAILGSKNPILQQSTLYAHYSLPEQYTNALVLVAQMMHDKDKNGKSMWDSYDNKGNFIGGTRGVSQKGEKIAGYTSQEILKLKSVSVRIHAGYREDERTSLDLYSLGSAVMQFKRFMPNWLYEAWSHKRTVSNIGHLVETGTNTTIDENGIEKEVPILSWENAIEEGSARTFFKWLVQSVAHATRLNRLYVRDTAKGPVTTYRWHQLSPRQQANVISVNVRIAVTASVFMALNAIFAGDDSGDDEWERRFGRMNFDLANGLNPVDLLRAGVNPTVIMPRMYMMSEGLYDYVFESGLKGERIKTGKHEGEFKGKRKLRKVIPGLAQFDNAMGQPE
jgi:hypothetical protein